METRIPVSGGGALPSENQGTVASQRVADILAARILSGALGPGVRIKQDELAEELQTSRIPVRDALRMLEARGLVTMKANAGAHVVKLTHRDLEASFDVRERLEPLLLADSMERLTSEDVEALRDTLDKANTAETLDERARLYTEWHRISYRRHSSPLLAQIVERVWEATQSYRLASLRRLAEEMGDKAFLLDRGENDALEYSLQMDAIARGDVPTAQAALKVHIRRVRAAVLDEARGG